LPSTTSVSSTGAVISGSIVPVAHSCASSPMHSTGTMNTSSQTIQSKMVRMPAGCPGWKSRQNR
jgi:hypothetical protein